VVCIQTAVFHKDEASNDGAYAEAESIFCTEALPPVPH